MNNKTGSQVSQLHLIPYSQLARMCDTLKLGVSINNGTVAGVYSWKVD